MMDQRQFDDRNEHLQILQELRNIRNDFKEVMSVTREENNAHRKEVKDDLKEIKTKLNESAVEMESMRGEMGKVKQMATDSKAIIWKVGGAAIGTGSLALFKALGWF